jgi:DNA-binding SARP family transcriptional activator
VLSADWLIDIAWGEWPPRTARQNLHTYLWSLRRSPAAAAGPRLAILERPPGYLLRADELGVDPSPGLNRLYVAMLRADAALDWPGPVPGALPPGPPGALTRPSRS